MMTIADISKLAEEAGRAGRTFQEWASDDVVQEFCASFDGKLPIEEWKRAFDAGRSSTWIIRWTTAPADYDSFGTFTVQQDGEWSGKPLRQVKIDPDHLGYQCSRYGSGLHGVWDRDPREVEREIEARRAADRAEIEAREAKRAASLEWLKSASDADLDSAIDSDDDGPWSGLSWSDLRAARRERREQAETRAKSAEMAECRALIPDGSVLVDDGDGGGYSKIGTSTFRRAPRDSHVYFDISITPGSPVEDADRAVVYAGREEVGTLKLVAERIRDGFLRAAPLASVPPRKVLDRIGHDKLKKIRKLDVDGREVWVGRPRFDEIMVLDGEGKLIRAKGLRERAIQMASCGGCGRIAEPDLGWSTRDGRPVCPGCQES